MDRIIDVFPPHQQAQIRTQLSESLQGVIAQTLVPKIGGGRIADTCRGDFGYWLGEPWHGRALMQEAAPAYVAALRARLALDSIEATCQPENRGSARVLAACGLQCVGTRTMHAPARGREELVDLWERTWTRDAPG